jgi:hypothetical protein
MPCGGEAVCIHFLRAMILGSLVAALLLPFGYCSNEITNTETGVAMLGASGSARMTWYNSYPACCCKSFRRIIF